MDCNSCKEKREQERPTISRYAFESALTAMELTVKRLWIVILILIVLLAGSNGAWIYYESQMETVETEITQEADGDGVNNFIGEDGNIIYGATDYQNPPESP